jgi:hypothetical protein
VIIIIQSIGDNLFFICHTIVCRLSGSKQKPFRRFGIVHITASICSPPIHPQLVLNFGHLT